MRYLLELMHMLLLGLMGCSETAGMGGSGGDGGNGGAAGVGGNGGDGGTGGGGVVTDCTGVDDDTACTVGDSPGFCFEDACSLQDCTGLEDGTRCAQEVGLPGLGGVVVHWWCLDDSCGPWVGDCNGFEDLQPCSVDSNEGFCVEESCEPAVSDCEGQEDGTLCSELPPHFGGFCVGGVCEIPQ